MREGNNLYVNIIEPLGHQAKETNSLCKSMTKSLTSLRLNLSRNFVILTVTYLGRNR